MRVPWIGIVFWIGLFGWLAFHAWAKVQRERERQQTLRRFAERGTPLDQQTIEKLLPQAHGWRGGHGGDHPHSLESMARGMTVGGIVMTFAGVGLALGAQVIGRTNEDALYGMSTGAVVVGCLGLGLITASYVLRRMRGRHAAGGNDSGR